MAAKLIVSPDRLKVWLGLGDDTDVPEGVLEESIRAAQIKIESLLDTSLQETSRVEVFEAGARSWPEGLGVQKLLLATGFVKEATLTGVSAWNASTGTTLVGSDYSLDREAGVITLDEAVAYKFLRVEYQSGVTRQTAPEWLQVGILAQAPLLFGLPENLPDTRGAKNFKDQLAAMYAVHNRIVPFAKRAVAAWLL